MKYYYKSKNKFPHIIDVKLHSIFLSDSPQDDLIFSWLEDNVGKYKVDWLCLKRKLVSASLGELIWRYPIAFKTKEKAMAFKLRWS